MRRPTETVEDFRRRINMKARGDGFAAENIATESGWFLGPKQHQSSGSLHTDIWTGTAAELANKDAIAVFPVAGWWKNRARYDQSEMGVDYSLIISIDSPEVDVDLWTPIATQIGVAIPIET